MNNSIIQNIKKSYSDVFSANPRLVRAPGRINLIGEHTDYNLGFVFPAAVAQSIYFAIGATDKPYSSAISLDQDETFQFKLENITPVNEKSWKNYILGVVGEIQKTGREVRNFNVVFAGDIPMGSGMSSSAALECGLGLGLNELFDLGFSRVELAHMGQAAEHNYVGVKCGIMDQFASLMGKKDQAFVLDCKSLDYTYFPLNLEEYEWLLINSNVHHSLADSEYNVRRQQCEEGVEIVKTKFPEAHSLRDVSFEMLGELKTKMDRLVYKRCKYVLEENNRVEEMSKALKSNDLTRVGEILKRGQLGMKEEYEITCPEIDFLADFANAHDAVLGARMMGGGFGGCTINLVKKSHRQSFIKSISSHYSNAFSQNIAAVPVSIGDGVELISDIYAQ